MSSIKKLSPFVVSLLYYAYAIINGLVFSVIFVAYDISTISSAFFITALLFGGLAIYGGVIGAVITAIIFCKVKKKHFGQIADTAILGLLVGQIIGRWGNFINREAYGVATSNSNPLAMRLFSGKEYIQVHPTFLYESLWNLLVLILILIFRRKKAFQGEVFIWYLGGYGLGRFFIEGIRSDQLLLPWGWPVSQVLSALLVIGAIVAEIVIRKRIKKMQSGKLG